MTQTISRFKLANEVRNALKAISEQNPKLSRTLGEYCLLSLPKEALESCSESDLKAGIGLASHGYSIPSGLINNLFQIRKESLRWSGQRKLEEYWKNAEKYQQLIKDYNHFPNPNSNRLNLEYARELSRELGVNFDESRVKKVMADKEAQYMEFYRDSVDRLDAELKELDKVYAIERNKKTNRIAGLESSLIDSPYVFNSNIGVLMNGLSSMKKSTLPSFESPDKKSLDKFKKVSKVIAIGSLIGLLGFVGGYSISNHINKQKIGKLYD